MGTLAAESDVMSSAAMSLIVDKEQVDDDTDDDEGSVAIISVVMAVVAQLDTTFDKPNKVLIIIFSQSSESVS